MDITWLIVIVYLIGLGLWTKRQNTIYMRQLAKTSAAQNAYMVILSRRHADPLQVASLKQIYEQEMAALKAMEKKP